MLEALRRRPDIFQHRLRGGRQPWRPTALLSVCATPTAFSPSCNATSCYSREPRPAPGMSRGLPGLAPRARPGLPAARPAQLQCGGGTGPAAFASAPACLRRVQNSHLALAERGGQMWRCIPPAPFPTRTHLSRRSRVVVSRPKPCALGHLFTYGGADLQRLLRIVVQPSAGPAFECTCTRACILKRSHGLDLAHLFGRGRPAFPDDLADGPPRKLTHARGRTLHRKGLAIAKDDILAPCDRRALRPAENLSGTIARARSNTRSGGREHHALDRLARHRRPADTCRNVPVRCQGEVSTAVPPRLAGEGAPGERWADSKNMERARKQTSGDQTRAMEPRIICARAPRRYPLCEGPARTNCTLCARGNERDWAH